MSYLRGPFSNRAPARAIDLRAATEQAYWQVRAFYLINLLIAFDLIRLLYTHATTTAVPAPRLPVFWIGWVSMESAVYMIGLFLPVAALLALLRPHAWWPRLLVFVAVLEAAAFENSFGSINHGLHYPVWVAFLLLFAPPQAPGSGQKAVSVHMRYLFPVVVAQVFIGLFYTLSGLHKARLGFFSTDVSSFHPDALPLLVMARWEQTGVEPMLGEFFAQNTWLAWPAYLAVIYFECAFLVAVFRPQIHRIFGVAFALFHMGVWLVMGINFPYQPVMVALLFIWSPFAIFDHAPIAHRLGQLPGIDLIIWMRRLYLTRHASAAFG